MKKLGILALGLALLAVPASARTHIFHKPNPIGFIKHHKLMLATSALFVAADIADIQTTISAQQRCPTCVETSDLYGQHPSAGRLWGESMAIDAAYVAFDWYGTSESDTMGAKGFTAAQRKEHPALYRLCWLERPVTVAIMSYGAAEHIKGAYHNAGLGTR